MPVCVTLLYHNYSLAVGLHSENEIDSVDRVGAPQFGTAIKIRLGLFGLSMGTLCLSFLLFVIEKLLGYEFPSEIQDWLIILGVIVPFCGGITLTIWCSKRIWPLIVIWAPMACAFIWYSIRAVLGTD